MRILIADDDESMRRYLATCFEGNSQFQFVVTIVANGEEALKKVKQGLNFDLLLTDNDMGKLKGTDLAPLVKNKLPNVRIILMSGKEVNIESLPIDCFILKPFSLPVLLRKIEELMS